MHIGEQRLSIRAQDAREALKRPDKRIRGSAGTAVFFAKS